MKTSHEFDVDRFQAYDNVSKLEVYSTWGLKSSAPYSRMTRRLDEIDTSMYPVIDQFQSIDPILLFEIRIETRFDIVNDGFPARLQVG